jgi:hypothetical protein
MVQSSFSINSIVLTRHCGSEELCPVEMAYEVHKVGISAASVRGKKSGGRKLLAFQGWTTLL